MTKKHEGGLTTKEKIKIIQDFKKNNPNGKVVLTGGETMLKYDEFFSLSKECLKLGLVCATNTNASLINDENIEKVLKNGPKYLVVSLDSCIEKCHDYSRGINGSFKHTIDILDKMVKMKKLKDYKTEIITNSVIYDMNINNLSDYITFAESLGIDGCIFQMISRTFFRKGARDVFFEKHFFKDKKNALSRMQEIIDNLDEHKIIRTTHSLEMLVLNWQNSIMSHLPIMIVR
jgi:MoaA/NifB/PqqE/SkfB family radical SAM enzyme